MKCVVNGVYETDKMKVEIGEDTVSKLFKKIGNANIRYKREKISLQRLSHYRYFPKLISFKDEYNNITMSRLAGNQPVKLSIKQIEILRKMVIAMHKEGVARHAIPIRDLLCSNDQELGMVDFERVTLRSFPFSPLWFIAKKVSNYHLYRLIQNHQPKLLTVSEKRILSRTNQVRAILQKIKPLKKFVKGIFKG